IMKDLLLSMGIKKDLEDMELTDEEVAKVDLSKLDVSFINNHPEYQEVKPFLGDMTTQQLKDVIESGYLDQTVSFENFKGALPKTHEMATTLVGQIFAPKIALGV